MSKESELNAMFELIAQIQTLQLVMNAKVVAYLRETNETPVPTPFSNPQEVLDYVMSVESNQPATSPFSSDGNQAPAFGSTPPVEPSPTPVFAAPPFAAQDPHPIPFSNSQELMDYVMGVYSQSQDQMKMGGAIQGVLKDLGALQLSDIEPERYALLFQRIEALK